jgi:hypothetical protein
MKSYKNKTKRRGGAATVFPLKYFDSSAIEPSVSAGRDLLGSNPPTLIRPKIGGRRSRRVIKKQQSNQRGGFVPSVMGGFISAASKYIVPIALFAGYKMMTRKGKKGSRRRQSRRVR